MATSTMNQRTMPSIPVGRTWAVTTTSGFTANGYLPSWAEDDPSATGIHVDRLPIVLADISHNVTFEGQPMTVWAPGCPDESASTGEAPVLWGTLGCTPYGENTDSRVPVVNLAIVDDYWINNLDPEGLSKIVSQLRAQAERLENEVLPQLVAARADWAEHNLP